MSKSNGIPDAWDDDYEAVVDQKQAVLVPAQPPPPVKMSRAERKAQHAEANKQLWQSAENPETFHFVEARNNVPLKSDFKPQLTVLSRRVQRPSAANVDNDEDDSEEEARKAQQATLVERQQKAQREREEKQRKYAEVRERLFGSPSPVGESTSGRSSPTKLVTNGKIRAGRGARRGGADISGRGSPSTSSADHSPARSSNQLRELYDPDYSGKSNTSVLQRPVSGLQQPVRNPRGPDGSGKGGFGFASRGDKTNGS